MSDTVCECVWVWLMCASACCSPVLTVIRTRNSDSLHALLNSPQHVSPSIVNRYDEEKDEELPPEEQKVYRLADGQEVLGVRVDRWVRASGSGRVKSLFHRLLCGGWQCAARFAWLRCPHQLLSAGAACHVELCCVVALSLFASLL